MNDPRDNLDWEAVDRLDWHLWILTILLLLVLGISVLGFMLPTVFWFGKDLGLAAPERAFFAYCIFLGLVLVYLMQRQAVVRRLKRQLFEAGKSLREAEQATAIQVLLTLPEQPQFRDALAMEFRRASASGTNLSEAVFQLPQGSREQLALLASALRTLLRRGESMYRIGDHGIAVILPHTSLATAASFASQVRDYLRFTKEELEVRVTSYPEEASSLKELETVFMNEDGRLITAFRDRH